MEPVPQERKEKKGWNVLAMLRKALLLKRSRGATSEHEEDKNESHRTRDARNTEGARTEELRRTKKSLLKKALRLCTKWRRRQVEDSGLNDGSGPSSQSAPPRGDDGGQNDVAGPSSEGAPLQRDGGGRKDAAGPSSEGAPLRGYDNGQFDVAGPSSARAPPRVYDSGWNKGAGPSAKMAPPQVYDSGRIDGAGPSSERAPPRSQTSTINHKRALDWRQSKTQLNTVTPELLELKARPSHLGDLQGSTITLPEKKSSSSRRKLSEVPVE
ncbi:hypothetical protein AOLI_G00130650, partial [Acnodon oligacanthus]